MGYPSELCFTGSWIDCLAGRKAEGQNRVMGESSSNTFTGGLTRNVSLEVSSRRAEVSGALPWQALSRKKLFRAEHDRKEHEPSWLRTTIVTAGAAAAAASRIVGGAIKGMRTEGGKGRPKQLHPQKMFKQEQSWKNLCLEELEREWQISLFYR